MKEKKEKTPAIGIENCRKRLELLYPDRFNLTTVQENRQYKNQTNYSTTMKKFSCIAIDDEPLALLVITQFCERFGNLDLSTFSEPRIGLEEIKRHKPDLVFLDIEMNSINGLDIAHALPRECCFIFTTAHAQYALNGFDLDAVDFLHKPFAYERFKKSCRESHSQNRDRKKSPRISLSNKNMLT